MKIDKTESGYIISGDSAKDWNDFRASVLFVAGACSTDKTLPAFSAVNVEASDTGFSFVATDRYRMHWVNFGLQDKVGKAHLIPAKALKDIVKPVKGSAFELQLTPGGWEFSSNSAKISGALVDAEFPKNWQGLIPDHVEAIDSINFNPLILGDTLKAIASAYGKGATISARFAGKLRAICLDMFADDAGALVMPVRSI